MVSKNSEAHISQFPVNRRKSLQIQVGDIFIGGDSKITIQSMTNTKTTDIDATVRQIHELEQAGCDIVRVAVPNEKAALALKSIKTQINIPLVADIHFNHKLAIISIDSGADKIRINPGNIGSEKKIEQVLSKANERNLPIRIGVNSGSIEKDLLKKYGEPNADGMVESAMRHIRICEKFNFRNLIIALKASDVNMMIEANKKISQRTSYPLHLGVTEAGTTEMGIIKSSIGIGSLLNQGIGDTIRVSLTAPPVEEIKAGINILKALKMRHHGVTIISCPTCGRLDYNLFKIVKEVEERTADLKKPITVAIMGCVVNGPGEAREADIGIAGGKGKAILFKKGKIVNAFRENEILDILMREIENF
ncbi:4-hydroxy-3-methylbut-2-en-1-yl diphosphate synthase [candidate division KSB1 bacterium 4572_119]|nr:MAG: 4-hydroxy-3-methylbut-2-en-1-yl diphosphate synthase [candidate division KSB1 bacterium 4572_119]